MRMGRASRLQRWWCAVETVSTTSDIRNSQAVSFSVMARSPGGLREKDQMSICSNSKMEECRQVGPFHLLALEAVPIALGVPHSGQLAHDFVTNDAIAPHFQPVDSLVRRKRRANRLLGLSAGGTIDRPDTNRRGTAQAGLVRRERSSS